MSEVTVSADGIGERDLIRYLTSLLDAVSDISGYEFDVRKQFHGVRDSGSGQFAEKGEATSRPKETQTENSG